MITRLCCICMVLVWLSPKGNGQTQINYEAINKVVITNEASINTPNLESSPAFVGDKLGYVYTGAKNKFFDKLIDEAYFDIGMVDVEVDNSLSSRKTFYKKINSDLHEGAMAFDINSNRLFFTRSQIEKSLARKSDTTYLRIMTADLNQANPSVDMLEINVDRYSVCHPTLSQDGKTMIFSSNKPGGQGKMDLYVAYFDGAQWSGVQNLSKEINSPTNEIFPSLTNDSILIFASDRDKGFGGLDMYCSTLRHGEWTQPVIIPKPINSSFDDFGMIVRPDLISGYLTSTRLGGRGKDDIYRWSSEVPIFGINDQSSIPVVISVLDKLNLEPIKNVKAILTPLDINLNDFSMSNFNIDMLSGNQGNEMILKIKPKSSKNQKQYVGSQDGKVNVSAMANRKYLIQLEAEGYNPTNLIFDYAVFSEAFNMVMDPSDVNGLSIDSIYPEDTIATIVDMNSSEEIEISDNGKFTIKNLLFEYNSAEIKGGASSELEALIRYMENNENKSVRLESHTDCRGTADYNMLLSIRRAEGARSYMIARGVEASRIDIKGYGETKPLNGCSDRVACKEIEHQVNRRIECLLID
jgi:outer membrane protein OmpA-like peptidoglycan-associated protein